MEEEKLEYPLPEEFIIDITAKQLEYCKMLRNEYARMQKRGEVFTERKGQFEYYLDQIRKEANKDSRVAYAFFEQYVLQPYASKARKYLIKRLMMWLRATIDRKVRWGTKSQHRTYSKIDIYVRHHCNNYEEEIEVYSVLFFIERLKAWEVETKKARRQVEEEERNESNENEKKQRKRKRKEFFNENEKN